MILPILRRPILTAISIVSYLTYSSFKPTHRDDVTNDAVIEDCPECEQSVYTQPYFEGPTSSSTETAATSPTAFVTLVTPVIPSAFPDNNTVAFANVSDVCEVYNFAGCLEYFWMLTALWPILRFLPNRRKTRNAQQQEAQKDDLISELALEVESLEATVYEQESRIKELVLEKTSLQEMNATLSNLVEQRERDVENEKEKVDIYSKQNVAFSDARNEIQYALSRLQEENNTLRAHLHKTSSQYQRVMAELPSLLVPLHNVATSQPHQSLISFSAREGSIADTQTIHSINNNDNNLDNNQSILRDFLLG